LGLFASGIIEGLDRDVTTFQEGYDSTIFGFTAGGDYRFTNKFLAGLAFTYTSMDADFTGGGDFNTKSYIPTLFASYLPTQESFIQVVGAYTRNNFTVNRLASYQQANGTPITMGTASSDAYGNVWSLAFLAGYDKTIRNVTLGPRLGLNWSNVQLQDYQETGTTGLELAYNDQWVNSLQSVVGLYASAAYSTTVAVFVPQITADYIHEFANSQRLVEAQFVQDLRANPTRFNFQNETPVRNFFNLGVGLVAVLPNGLQPYANFRAMVGNEQFNNYAGILGLRLEFGSL
jgi:outer membrane autotransporter protein